jgi:hypothetical protein
MELACFWEIQTQVPQLPQVIKHEAEKWVQGGTLSLGCLFRDE